MRSFRSLTMMAALALACLSMPVHAADLPDGDGIAYAKHTIILDGSMVSTDSAAYAVPEAFAVNGDVTFESKAKLAVFPSGGEGGEGGGEDVLAVSDFHPNKRLNL
jgi:hypothetical protein